MATGTVSSTISDQLDKIESNLPTIPAKMMRLQRTMAGVAVGAVQALAGSTKDVIDIARVGGKTVTGQARAARKDVSRSARLGAKAVVGQHVPLPARHVPLPARHVRPPSASPTRASWAPVPSRARRAPRVVGLPAPLETGWSG